MRSSAVLTPALALLIATCLASPAPALENENLLVTMPPGYKVGFNKRAQNQAITEMVPSGETVENWTEMVTVQIYFGLKGSIVGYRAKMEKDWANVCAGAQIRAGRRWSRQRLDHHHDVAADLSAQQANRQARDHLVQGDRRR